MLALSKRKGCEIVRGWIRSILQQLYYCARVGNGDGDMVEAMWTAVANHIVNVHEHSNERYPRCEHGQIEDRVWLIKGMNN